MNHNSQYDSDYYGTNQQTNTNTYEYVFSQGGGHQKPPQQSKGGRAVLIAIGILLTVSLCFAAGFGGAYYAQRLVGGSSSDTLINSAPSQSDLHNDNPEELLEKSESQPSLYGSAGDEVFSVLQVVQKVQDSVVVIQADNAGSGSGVIISADGYILTCHHVIENASDITVTLNSGTKYVAKIVGSDSNSDLAVIRIQPNENEPLTYAEQGCSADLLVGEVVVAIGNPLGTLDGTVTSGIISAKERNVQTSDGTVMTLLQTDAAINSGNSGGGLFNLDGQLIGIVNAKYASAGVEGLAFAIPIDSAYTVQLDLIQYGYVRGITDHGLEMVDVTNANWYNAYVYFLRYYNIKIQTLGVYAISSEYTDQIQPADQIISVNGNKIQTASDIEAVIRNCKVGETVTFVISRNGIQHTVDITLREYVPDYAKDNQ